MIPLTGSVLSRRVRVRVRVRAAIKAGPSQAALFFPRSAPGDARRDAAVSARTAAPLPPPPPPPRLLLLHHRAQPLR